MRLWDAIQSLPAVVVIGVRRPAASVHLEITPGRWSDAMRPAIAERSIPGDAITVGRLSAGHRVTGITVERDGCPAGRQREDAVCGCGQRWAAALWAGVDEIER